LLFLLVGGKGASTGGEGYVLDTAVNQFYHDSGRYFPKSCAVMRQFLVFAIVFAVAFRRAVVAVRLVREPVLPVRLAVGIGFAVHATFVNVRVVDRRLRRRRRRARRGLARRGRHVVRIGMGLALMVQIDAINDRVVLVACAQ